MSNNGKAVLIAFFVMLTNISLCMEQEQQSAKITESAKRSQQNPPSASQAIKVSQDSSSFEARQSLSPTGQSPIEQKVLVLGVPTWTGLTNYVSNSWGSFTETVANRASNDAAFKKLGWPLSDPIAQNELKKTLEKYNEILKEPNFALRCQYLDTIVNRVGYLARVYEDLPNRKDDSALLVRHCIKHHASVMPHPLKHLFTQYLEDKKAEYIDAHMIAQMIVLPDCNHEKPSSKAEYFSDSATTSESNEMLDKKLLAKIGYSSDITWSEKARIYLSKCIILYKLKALLIKKENVERLKTADGRHSLGIPEDKKIIDMITNTIRLQKFIHKRRDFIQKIYTWLGTRGDSLQLAGHCLQYHRYVMPPALQDEFSQFIEDMKQQAIAIAEQFLPKNANQANVEKKR